MCGLAVREGFINKDWQHPCHLMALALQTRTLAVSAQEHNYCKSKGWESTGWEGKHINQVGKRKERILGRGDIGGWGPWGGELFTLGEGCCWLEMVHAVAKALVKAQCGDTPALITGLKCFLGSGHEVENGKRCAWRWRGKEWPYCAKAWKSY